MLIINRKKQSSKKRKRFRWEIVFLILIFLSVFLARLYFAFSEKEFSDDKSYYALRQIESIKESKHPIYNDNLSFGGKFNPFLPLYYALLSIFSLFMPSYLVGKIIPNLLISSSVFFSYMIFHSLSKNKVYSLFGTVVLSFIPVFFSETLNVISDNSLLIPLFLLAVYCFLNLDNKNNLVLYVVLVVLMSFVSSKTLIFVISLFVYLILIKLQKLKAEKKELELVFFTTFFSLWVSFLFYKRALLFHGLGFIGQNIPQQILRDFFSSLTILEAIYGIGILPLLAGIYMIYKGMIQKNRKSTFLASVAITTTLLLWLKLIPLKTGMIFLGISLSLFFAGFLKNFSKFLEKTRFPKTKPLFLAAMAVLIVLTLILPSFSYSRKILEEAPKASVIKALRWFRFNSDNSSKIVSTYDSGNLVSYISNRKNTIDSNFFLVKDISQRYEDIERIYKTKSEIEAIRLMNKYNANYILFSHKIRDDLDIDKLDYVENSNCFPLVYDHITKIYRLDCTIKEKKEN